MAKASYHSIPEIGEEDEQDDLLTPDSSVSYWFPTHRSDPDPLSLRCNPDRVSAVDEELVGGFSSDLESSDRSLRRARGASGSGSVGEISDRVNQVHFVMDLFQQRVEQSHRIAGEGFGSDPLLESEFGVIERISEEIGVNSSEIDVGDLLGLGFESEGNTGILGRGTGDDHDDYWGRFLVSDCGDEFYVPRRGNESGNGENFSSGGRGGERRENGFSGRLNASDCESDSEENADEMLGIDLHSEVDDYAANNGNDDYMSFPLRWDSLQLEDNQDTSDEFEWEEVDSRMEVMSNTVDYTEAESFLGLPSIAVDEEEVIEARERREWEVLINANNLERNIVMENEDGPDFGVHDDYYIYTAEYETIFGQFADGENAFMGNPPASKSLVKNLPLIAVTDEDVSNGNALCAVCKDEMEVGERAKQLPCSHRYHGDCIVPWLGIRNTCPVCRYGLPTDDPDYERRNPRASRAQ